MDHKRLPAAGEKAGMASEFLSVGLPICSVALVALVGIILNYKGEGRLRAEIVRMDDRLREDATKMESRLVAELSKVEERLVTALSDLRADIRTLHGELRADIKAIDDKVQTFSESVANHEGRIGGLERKRA